jgi:hypothetical protein
MAAVAGAVAAGLAAGLTVALRATVYDFFNSPSVV